MKARKIKVLKVAPGEHPQVVILENDLDALQKAVSIGCDHQGLIEVVGLEKGVCILCNEEGKLLNLAGNRRLGGDIIAGVFYVVGEDKCGTTTMNIYSHVLPSSAREAAEKIGQLVYFSDAG